MNDQLWNQIYHLLHFGLAYTLLLYLWPKLLFTKYTEDRMEQAIANYLLMAFLVMSISFILIALHLFEFMSVNAVLLLLTYHKYVSGRKSKKITSQPNNLVTWIYDYLEGLIHLRSIVSDSVQREKARLKNDLKRNVKFGFSSLSLILVIVIFVISAYIRFYDALHSPVPNMSDGWVVLKWVKFAEAQTLYPDGLYPAGYQVFLATIRKFADIDVLYLIKYVGPLNMMFIMIGYYFVITRFTGNKTAAIISLIVYGILSPLFFSFSYERQAASMSQEFAFAFVFISLYFYIQYLRTGNRYAIWAATAGTSITGLTHSIPYVWIGMGMGWIVLIHVMIMGKQQLKRLYYFILSGIGTVLISLTPVVLAYLFHVEMNTGVTSFAGSEKASFLPPDLRVMDILALLSVVILFIHGCFKKTEKLGRLPELLISLFVLSTFAIYYFGGYTHKELVIVRSRDLWYTCIPLAIGMGWYSMFQMASNIKIKRHIEIAIVYALFIISLYIVPPKPIIPYKLESKVTVEQFMRIANSFKPQQFLIVSPRAQMFPLVYGKGSHIYVEDGSPSLIKEYDPFGTPLTKFGESKHEQVAADIFIFYEKEIYEVNESERVSEIEAPKYQKYAREYKSLQEWINISKASIPQEDFSVFYEDNNLIIYHLHREDTEDDRKDQVNKIWS